MNHRVFADFDQIELDAQYNNQAACPGFADILGHGALLSRNAAGLAGERNVRWGVDQRESLDIYVPASSGPYPVMVYVHGGGWQSLDKECSAFAAPAFTAAGYMLVVLGFHTIPNVDFATMVERVRCGIGWIAHHIYRHGGDPQRVVLVGHSSGSHLVSQCLTNDWTTHGLSPNPFAGAMLVSGLGDLEPVRLCYRNNRLKLSQSEVARYSLLSNDVNARCPVDVVTAEHDTPEFQRQAMEVADYLSANRLLRKHYTVPERNHFDVILDIADSDSLLFRNTCTLGSR